MKKLLLVAALCLNSAQAVDFEAVEVSTRVINGALRGALLPESSSAEYIAGYGLHFTSSSFSFIQGGGEAAIEKLTALLPGLASTVQGLEQGEWVSAAHAADTHVLVRVKPNQPDTLEVWVDGVKR